MNIYKSKNKLYSSSLQCEKHTNLYSPFQISSPHRSTGTQLVKLW